ncbi:uncharacterized protein NPIL_378551 [Nephila pilipes]|uniref:Uncharacterized protein n=1 Tax=Nephila pilipes TaxID=299642 RepID=A0A8X6NII3_NEPPI|nr:uncharacterized protein NPIL_378551 [Nephila pilipes]
MDFVLSLQHLALVRVAITVYNSPEITDIKEKFKNALGSTDSREWKPLMLEKLKNSVLPDILHEKLLSILQPISLEIESWKEDMLDCVIHKPLDICWKSIGMIDREETAKRFVRSNDSDVLQRFAMACSFWMFDDVQKIWNKATVYERIHIEMTLMQEKKHSTSNETEERNPKRSKTNKVSEFWVMWFNWLHNGANPTTRYPSQQQRDRNKSLSWSFTVLSETSPQQTLPICKLHELMQQKYISKNYGHMYFSCRDDTLKTNYLQKAPLMILEYFLRWPLQFKFLEIAGLAWNHLKKSDFFSIMLYIYQQKISKCCSDFDYVSLLQEFWDQSPEHFKAYAKERGRFIWIKNYINEKL